MRAITEGEVIAVFRKCRRCGRHRTVGWFTRHSKTCRPCYQGWRYSPGLWARARAIALTDKGRRTVAQLLAEDVASEAQKRDQARATTPDPQPQGK